MVEAAGDNCQVKLNSKIVSLNISGEGGKVVAVTENGETITADNCMISAGPWTNSVLETAGLPPLNLNIWHVQWGHYEVYPCHISLNYLFLPSGKLFKSLILSTQFEYFLQLNPWHGAQDQDLHLLKILKLKLKLNPWHGEHFQHHQEL
jgi:hypothetical protein